MNSYSKESQLKHNRIKPEVIKTFGSVSKGSFGKKPSNGDFGKNSTPLKKKATKVKKNDIVDDKYSNWLALQGCCISGIEAPRGLGQDNIHCHHIYGRSGGRNDYKQVPLIGFIHSWGEQSLHSYAESDFIKLHNIKLKENEKLKDYFKSLSDYYNKKYIKQGGIIKKLDKLL